MRNAKDRTREARKDCEMRSKVSVGGRHRKNDDRHLQNYVGKLELTADDDADAFLFAAIYRAFHGREDQARALRRSIIAEARRCEKDHNEVVKSNAKRRKKRT